MFDTKRLFLGIISIAILAVGGYYFLSITSVSEANPFVASLQSVTKAVAGASDSLLEKSSKNKQDDGTTSEVKEQINALKSEVAKINVAEVASSSPQIQKILNDLKALQNLPRNQAKDACERVCKNL